MEVELDQYIEYLLSNQPKTYLPVTTDDQYDNRISFLCKSKKMSKEDLFLDAVKNNNLILFRKMISNTGFDPSYMNNESVIQAVLNNNYIMLSILIKDPRIKPFDQNNLGIRIAINKKDKTMVELFLSHEGVLQSIYHDPDLLSYMWVYQNNGKIMI